MGQKRGNDSSQLTKEEFASLNDEGSSGSNIKYGMDKADEKILRKRRIISVSASEKWKKTKPPSQPAAAPAFNFNSAIASSNNTNASSGKNTNAFPGIGLTSQSNKPVIVPTLSSQHRPEVKDQSPKTSSNPFASISIVNSSSTEPKFPPILTPATARATVNRNLSTTSHYPSQMHVAPTNNSTATTKNATNKKLRQSEKLNRDFFSFIMAEDEKSVRDITVWTETMDEYIHYATEAKAKAEEQKKKEQALKQKQTSKTSALPFPMQMSVPKATGTAANSFLTPASAPSTSPGTTISFGTKLTSTTSSNNNSTFNNPFSLNKPKSSTLESNKNNDEDDKLEKPEEALSDTTNTDETTVFSVRGKYFQLKENKWNDRGIGKIQLYQHKINSNQKRLVMRNTVGKVQLNVSIGKGMSFEKAVRKKSGAIRFLGVLEEGGDPTPIMLLVSHESLDPFHSALENMAA